MRLVRLNGELGKKYGRVHKLDVRTPAEAVRALCANYPELQTDLATSTDRGVGYKCVLDKERIDETALMSPMSQSFSMTPVVTGAGKVGSIILGVALLGVALAATGGLAGIGVSGFGGLFGSTAAFGTSVGFLGLTYGSIAWMGVALTLGGIAQMLAPTPKMSNTTAEKKENPYFDGPVNVTAQGGPVPVGYGRMIVGSAVISAAVTVEQAPDLTTPFDFRMNGFAAGVNQL